MKRLLLSLALVGAASTGVAAQDEFLRRVRSGPLPVERTGEDVYRAACVTCHGPDGTGSPKSVVGFAVPVPDFSDCAFSTAEPDPDWYAVVHEGGSIRGLDRRMPAFGDALSREDIALVVGHLRTFCKDSTWPRGDLNLPRAFFTEKAFPENEFVWATTFTERGERSVTSDLIYERRLGPRSQVELVVPLSFGRGAAEAGSHGLGDVALAFKRTVFASLSAGHIASVGLEISLPTGKEQLGLGNGYTVFEPFATWGQILPRSGGVELPTDSTQGIREAYLRTALLAILLFGLVGTGTELLLIGHDADGWQRIPLVVLAVSVLASLGMVMLGSTSAAAAVTRLFRGAMVLLMLSGAAGSVLHYRASMEFKREMDPSLSGFALFSSVVQAKAPPALSPGTMALLGLLGFACVFRLNPPASPRSS